MITECLRIVDRLDVNEVKDGLIVYDQRSDQVHHLNATAAIVFTLCDGRNDASAIAGAVASAFGLAEPPLAEVTTCLRSLVDQGLVR